MADSGRGHSDDRRGKRPDILDGHDDLVRREPRYQEVLAHSGAGVDRLVAEDAPAPDPAGAEGREAHV
jgi:hypothetical protein